MGNNHAPAASQSTGIPCWSGRLGLARIDLGGLKVGAYLQPFAGGPLPAVNLLNLVATR
jgi:hypothetical protein